jgi:hypothetical protein
VLSGSQLYGLVVADEDGGGREFQRIADVLRAEIADGIHPVGSNLPPQRMLVDRFKVSRDTVQRALRVLIAEGVIESQQGKGSKVLKKVPAEERQQIYSTSGARSGTVGGRPSLGPFIEAAFEGQYVTLDVSTLTSESLDTHIRLQAERVRSKQIRPKSISVRLLLPTEGAKLAFPRLRDDPRDLRPLERLHRIVRRHTDSLRAALEDLRTEKLVEAVDIQIRTVPFTPTFKLYLLNEAQALHGLYVPVERAMRLDDGREADALDVLGLGATLFHYVKDDKDPESQSSLFVDSLQLWFDNHWKLIGEKPA